MLLPIIITCHLLFSCFALANTEKIIFLGPEAVEIPNISPGLGDLSLVTLSPSKPTFRARLPRAFPTPGEDQGLQSWFLLDGLERGQRYEIRVCWAATVRYALSTGFRVISISFPLFKWFTWYLNRRLSRNQQPSQFSIYTHQLQKVFDTPSLISALGIYSEAHKSSEELLGSPTQRSAVAPSLTTKNSSLLFLQMFSAADYYTSNRTLMNYPPPVDIEISS